MSKIWADLTDCVRLDATRGKSRLTTTTQTIGRDDDDNDVESTQLHRGAATTTTSKTRRASECRDVVSRCTR